MSAIFENIPDSRASEELFVQLGERLREVFWVTDARNNRLIYLSPGFAEVWGRPRDALMTDTWAFLNFLHPDDVARMAGLTGAKEFSEEFRVIRGDGAMRWLRARCTLLTDPQGEPYRTVGIAEDITRRKDVELRLRQSETRFRTLAETSFEGVAIFDTGRVRACNKTFSALFGYTSDAIVGQRMLRFIDPAWRRSILQEQPHDPQRSYEARGLRSDGSTFWAEFRCQSIPYENQPVLVGTVRDITERRHNEDMRRRFIEQIIAAQEDERRRIARELHDTMAQSLTSLLVGLRAVEDLVDAPAARQALQNLRQLTAGTIEDAQRLARGLRPSVLDDLGFAPAIERLVADASRAHRFSVELHLGGFDAGKRLGPAMETALYRILQEALTNVARHAKATRVELLIERHPTFVRALVEDNGCGFDSRSKAPPCPGLGLLGIRERASLLRGQMAIDSSPGAGTTLTVTLPY